MGGGNIKARFRNAHGLDEALSLLTGDQTGHRFTRKIFRSKKKLWEEGVYENVNTLAKRDTDHRRNIRSKDQKVTLPTVKFLEKKDNE